MIINYDKSKKIITEQEILESENHNTATQSKLLENENVELEKRKKYRENVFGLKAPKGRIIISIDLDYKNWVNIGFGTNLRLERDNDNLDRKYTAPTNAYVIDAENIPIGAEIIVQHNCDHDTNRIFSVDEDMDVQNLHYYSIPVEAAYIWRLGEDEWKPCENFALGLRVFEPYNGIIEGVLPKELKDTIFITSDCDIKGKVVKTLKASLYEMCFNDSNSKEKRIIRIRHSENTNYDREEVVVICNYLTQKVKNKELLIGVNIKNAKYVD
jgi:hypothetical protein